MTDPRQMTVALRAQWASVQPFGAPDQKTDFTPGRVAIEKLDGRVVAESGSPRDSFAGGFATRHYTDDIVEFDRIKVPTKRRAYRCDATGQIMPGELMVAIDLSDVRFS